MFVRSRSSSLITASDDEVNVNFTQSFDFKKFQDHCDGGGERGGRGASQAGAPCGEPAGGGGQ